MLRNEIQKKTGLTRKAIEYYEQKGLINPEKAENGYRYYSEEDLEILRKISMFRKLGIKMEEIKKLISYDINYLSSILRNKQHQIDLDQKREKVLELIIEGVSEEIISEKIKIIDVEETIYERLIGAFPGYFGQIFFAAYKGFLNEPLDKDGEEAYEELVNYLDLLPALDLTEDEIAYIDELSSTFDMESLGAINEEKIRAVENIEEWLNDNKDSISKYQDYKSSEAYLNSPIKVIYDKLQKYMVENKYYEIAIPLLRKMSKSYDDYYKKLLKANDLYLMQKSKGKWYNNIS